MKRVIMVLWFVLLANTFILAQVRTGPDISKAPPTISEKTAGMQRFPGYFPFYWDARAGKIWLEIDKWNSEFLYVESLPGGIGSNDIGLDRGQLGQSYIVRFERTGPRVLLTASNYAYRANSDNADERRAVKDASLNRRCGDLKSRLKKGIARWLTRRVSIFAMRTRFRQYCSDRSRVLFASIQLGAPFISPTPGIFRRIQKSKPRLPSGPKPRRDRCSAR